MIRGKLLKRKDIKGAYGTMTLKQLDDSNIYNTHFLFPETSLIDLYPRIASRESAERLLTHYELVYAVVEFNDVYPHPESVLLELLPVGGEHMRIQDVMEYIYMAMDIYSHTNWEGVQILESDEHTNHFVSIVKHELWRSTPIWMFAMLPMEARVEDFIPQLEDKSALDDFNMIEVRLFNDCRANYKVKSELVTKHIGRRKELLKPVSSLMWKISRVIEAYKESVT